MEYTLSISNDNRTKEGKQMIDERHNQREPKAVEKALYFDKIEGREPHIDISKSDMNVYIKNETVEEAYEHLFKDAVDEYNAKQKRKDRCTSIKREMEKIEKSPNQELRYEMIIQIGDREEHPDHEACKAMLERIAKLLEEKYINLYFYNIAIHMDEPNGTPHLHADYIPFYVPAKYDDENNAKKKSHGLSVKQGLKGAFEAMGYSNFDKEIFIEEDGHIEAKLIQDRKNGAKTQCFVNMREDVKEMLEHEYGIQIKDGDKVKRHLDKDELIEYKSSISHVNDLKAEIHNKEYDLKQKAHRKKLLENKMDSLIEERNRLEKEIQRLIQLKEKMVREFNEMKSMMEESLTNYIPRFINAYKYLDNIFTHYFTHEKETYMKVYEITQAIMEKGKKQLLNIKKHIDNQEVPEIKTQIDFKEVTEELETFVEEYDDYDDYER